MERKMDLASITSGLARPGIDTRQWCSYGTVLKETPDTKSVDFSPEVGPLVGVKLHPSGVKVPCRVANPIAGNGEGEWSPFIEGDEVLVLIPEGDERAACVIIARLNNEIDAWPKQVAGQDTTQNTFGFRRMRTPYILETASSYLLYSATTKAFLSLSPIGELTLSNADNAFFALHSDMITIQNGDADVLLQMDVKSKTIHIEAQGTKFILDSTNDSMLMTTGRLMIGTSGSIPLGHAVTVEQLAVILQGLLTSIGSTQPSNVIGAVLAAASIPIINAAIAYAATQPVTPMLGAITAALGTAPDPTGIKPGIGVAGLLLG
jgi:hypothetical protein